jgi:transposase
MKDVGVDLHKQTITIAVVDAARRGVVRRRFSNRQIEEIVQFLRSLGEFEITVEATTGYEWFVLLVEPLARRVVLAHPGKLRVIAESTRKSDRVDARVLAEMLAKDEIPPAYRPTPRQRAHRRLVRYRAYLQRRITACGTRCGTC